MPGPIEYGGPSAYYSPSTDRIQLPPRESFDRPAHYYQTAYHELGHAQDTPRNLDASRPASPLAAFRSPDDSKEELVAEMTSAFLSAEAGILEDSSRLRPATSRVG